MSDPSRTIRVIVADDSDDMRLLVRMAVERRTDVEVVAEAANGYEAIELVTALRPDLLVLDVEMPELDGIAALPALRAASADTRVVMLSAIDSDDNRARAHAAGAVAYLQKGIPVSDLVDELLRAADLLDILIASLSPAFSFDVPRSASSPRAARRFVGDTLDDWGATQLVDAVQLLVSELVTNVILHTSAAPEVSVRLLPDRVHVEVCDDDPTPLAPQSAAETATSGRGLAFVEALALDWGSTPTAGGKVVWFDVAR